jgi:uncharacterized membrane protein YeaQ/YmgE (transglycosylase-associated protein family)
VGILSWILFGLIAGALARLFFPGKQPFGIVMTLLVGLAGALAGGFVASALGAGGVDGFNVRSFLVAVGGAILLLFVYEALAGRERTRA